MDGLILSVMHSGTWFTRQLLKDHGFGNVRTWHYGEGEIPQTGWVITPVRHPSLVAGGWIRREKPLHTLWPCIEAMTRNHGMLLPVDSPKREAYLEAISERLGKPLTTEWVPVHSIGHAEYDGQWIVEKFKDFYGPIYG